MILKRKMLTCLGEISWLWRASIFTCES